MFHLTNQNEKIRVCKTFFLSTLNIGHAPVDDALKHNIGGAFSKPSQSIVPHNKTSDAQLQVIRDHIDKIPKMDSHYCRAHTRRQYIEPGLTITKLYEHYVDECNQNTIKPVSAFMYRQVFCKKFNISEFKPRKDQCQECSKECVTEQDKVIFSYIPTFNAM